VYPLWREDGSVIYSYNCFWALPEQVTLGSKSCRTHDHILLSHLRLPSTWRARSPYLYPPRTGWPSYTPGHWVPFSSPLTTRRDYGGSILTRFHTGRMSGAPAAMLHADWLDGMSLEDWHSEQNCFVGGYRPPWPVTWVALPFFLLLYIWKESIRICIFYFKHQITTD
jgi:hypothetical protein